MLFEGRYSMLVVEDLVEVAMDGSETMFVIHRSGAKTMTKYENKVQMTEDYNTLVECMRTLHGGSVVVGPQAPR